MRAVTVALPYVEQEAAGRAKQSIAAYNRKVFLLDTVLAKEVSYTDSGRLPVLSDITVDGRSIT